jgi:hypothetical protein
MNTKKTKKDSRQNINTGPGLDQVSPVAYWFKNNHFKNEDEARGAFRLAHQQGLDGMGKTTCEWMGLTPDEYNKWMKDDSLPAKRAVKKRVQSRITAQ